MDGQQYKTIVGLLALVLVLVIVAVVWMVVWWTDDDDNDCCTKCCVTGQTGPGEGVMTPYGTNQALTSLSSISITGFTSLESTLNMFGGGVGGPLAYYTFDCDVESFKTFISLQPSSVTALTGQLNDLQVIPRYASYTLDTPVMTGATMLADVVTGQSVPISMTIVPPTQSYVGVVTYELAAPLPRGTPIGFQMVVDPTSSVSGSGSILVAVRTLAKCVPSVECVDKNCGCS